MVTIKQVSEAIKSLRERRGSTMKQIHKLLKAEHGDRGAPSSYDVKKALERGFLTGHLQRSSTDQTPRFLLQSSTAGPDNLRIRVHAFAAKSTSGAKDRPASNHCRYCCCCKILKHMKGKSPKITIVIKKDKGGKTNGKSKSKKCRQRSRKATTKRKRTTKQSRKRRNQKNSRKTPRKSSANNSSSSDVSKQKSKPASRKRSKAKRDKSDKNSEDKGDSQSPMPMALFP